MGVDARIAIRFTNTPTHERVKELQFHLMHRFGTDMFWTKTLASGGGWETQNFIQPVTQGEYFFDSDYDATGLWQVSLYSRYYGEGYERGPGLKIAGILYYLNCQADIKEVRYGGDSSGTDGQTYTKHESIELFTKFCRDGRLPYTGYFDKASDRKPSEPERPSCTYCEVPMHRNGFGGKYAAFYCEGCGEDLALRDEEFDKWMSGKEYAGDRTVKITA